ncbi:MAG: flagellum-specific ATP synthase FliI, partial [Vagococcus sp.]
LSRKIAGENHYPAIDVQQSLSRLMKSIVSKEHNEKAGLLKENMAIYADAKDLIDIGAYKVGTNPKVDQAIELQPSIKSFLVQKVDEPSSYKETVQALNQVFSSKQTW